MPVLVLVAYIQGGVQTSKIHSATWTKWAYTALRRAASKEWQCFYQNLPERFALHLSFTALRDHYLTTHNIQQDTNIHAHGGIRTRNPNKEAAGEPTPETARLLGSAFTFHTMVIIKNAGLLNVTPCSLVQMEESFGEMFCDCDFRVSNNIYIVLLNQLHEFVY